VKDIRTALKDLPRGLQQLEKAYDQTFVPTESLDPDSVRLAQRVFYWITQARRPLSAAELQTALAVRVGDVELDDENLVMIDEAVAVCAGLVGQRKQHYPNYTLYHRRVHEAQESEMDI
jgi:hypothetical protein